MQASCAGGGTGTGDAVTRLLITPRLVRQVSGAVARQLGVRAYPTIMWLQLMDEGVTIAEHSGGRDAASLVAFAKAAPGMIEEGVAAQKAKEGKAEGAAEGGAAAASKIGQSKVGKSKVAAKAAEEAAAAAAEPAEGATEGAAAESKVSGSKLAAGAGVEKAATPAEAEAKAEAAPAAAAAAKECATGS